MIDAGRGVHVDLYLGCAGVALDLVADPEVGRCWDDGSALAGFTVGGLAAHLAGAVTRVEENLDASTSAGPPVSAAQYFAALPGLDDPASPLNASIVDRGLSEASAGHRALVERASGCLDRLSARLPTESPTRVVAPRGIPMTVDEYLRSRLVEIGLHTEDLALSVGLPVPTLPTAALDAAIEVLVSIAVSRHGHLPVLRALGRRERDSIDALRVL